MKYGDKKILGYDLHQTCGSAPEQYDVFKDGIQVGYLRERNDWFTAEVPDCGGELVHEGHVSILTEENLTEAIEAIDKYLKDDTTGTGTVRDFVKAMREVDMKESEMYWVEDGEQINIEVKITRIKKIE